VAPIVPGAEDEFYVRTFADTSLDVNGIASGSPDLVKTVLPVEARANVSIRLAPGQDPATVRAAFERLVCEGAPAGAELEVTLRNSSRPALTPADAPMLGLASDAFESVVGARPLLVRTGGSLPIYAALVDRGLPTLATGFGIESECNVHAPNENIRDDALELGVATMREVFVRLGELA
jgi:acetylornithine deacetylase/succinyl-diaminopimelate desuccinylase-like protein